MQDFNAVSVERGSVAILWLGQNSYVLKDSHGTVLTVDPYYPRERPADTFIHHEPPMEPGDIRIDAVLTTHDHGDHTYPESLAGLADAWPEARFYGPRESAARMRSTGIASSRVTEVSTKQYVYTVGSWTCYVVWAKPQGTPHPFKPEAGPDVDHLGFVLESDGVRVWVSGDPINAFAETPSLVEPVAALRPHVAIITWHPTEGEFPYLDGAVKMARLVGARVAIPSHYDCFVKRTYDPQVFARAFEGAGTPRPAIIGYRGTTVYRG